jgi:hypothetical protein
VTFSAGRPDLPWLPVSHHPPSECGPSRDRGGNCNGYDIRPWFGPCRRTVWCSTDTCIAPGLGMPGSAPRRCSIPDSLHRRRSSHGMLSSTFRPVVRGLRVHPPPGSGGRPLLVSAAGLLCRARHNNPAADTSSWQPRRDDLAARFFEPVAARPTRAVASLWRPARATSGMPSPCRFRRPRPVPNLPSAARVRLSRSAKMLGARSVAQAHEAGTGAPAWKGSLLCRPPELRPNTINKRWHFVLPGCPHVGG